MQNEKELLLDEYGKSLTSLRELKTVFEEYNPWMKRTYKALYTRIRTGEVDKWLKSIGETEFAKFMEKFNGSSFGKYKSAFNMAYFNVKGSKLDFKNMAGYEKQRTLAKSLLLEGSQNAQNFKKWGLRAGFGMLLYGPPGCGKTYLTRCLAGETKRPVFKASLIEFIHDGEEIMGLLMEIGNAILFLDEMECLSENRDEFPSSRINSNRTLGLINDSYFEEGNMMIGSTNSPWTLDPAMLRSGRLDSLIYMGFPSEEERLELLKYGFRKVPCVDVDFENIAKDMKFFSPSDIQNIARGVVHAKIEGEQEVKVTDSDVWAHLKNFCPTSIPWLETSASMNFNKYHKIRFPQMIKEIEEYKNQRERLKYNG